MDRGTSRVYKANAMGVLSPPPSVSGALMHLASQEARPQSPRSPDADPVKASKCRASVCFAWGQMEAWGRVRPEIVRKVWDFVHGAGIRLG